MSSLVIGAAAACEFGRSKTMSERGEVRLVVFRRGLRRFAESASAASDLLATETPSPRRMRARARKFAGEPWARRWKRWISFCSFEGRFDPAWRLCANCAKASQKVCSVPCSIPRESPSYCADRLPMEILERARMYLAACKRRGTKRPNPNAPDRGLTKTTSTISTSFPQHEMFWYP
jgi:hypothetical protein